MKRNIVVLALCFAGILAGCQSQSQGASAESAESSAEAVSAATEESTSDTTISEENAEAAGQAPETQESEGEESSMKIQVQANGNAIIFELNDSQAARELYGQLPLTVENEDFSNNEKTFYPPRKLNVSGAPHTDGSVGTLAYYEPWGDVVLFYGSYNPNGSLYELGKVTEGREFISEISGEMVITAVE